MSASSASDEPNREEKQSVIDLQLEIRDIATNPANKYHAGYVRNDPFVSAYLDERYREVYGSEQITL